jgi:hypothetical protein
MYSLVRQQLRIFNTFANLLNCYFPLDGVAGHFVKCDLNVSFVSSGQGNEQSSGSAGPGLGYVGELSIHDHLSFSGIVQFNCPY